MPLVLCILLTFADVICFLVVNIAVTVSENIIKWFGALRKC